MITKNIFKFIAACSVCCCVTAALTSCSDSYMEEMNTDETKAESIDPSAQLTTALLQTYGDFGFMDTYRSYITGFTQHFAGGWNVSNYAGDVHPQDDQMRLVWDQLYSVAIKNLVDAIANSEDKPNTNAALRVHRVYLMNMLTDIYGDIPCLDAGKGYTEGIATPKYDTQEDIYNFFFDELAACVEQLGTGADNIAGDVTSLNGSPAAWKRYANTLRLRYAMRISDVNPAKAKEEFEKALSAPGGYIENASQDAYVIYTDGPFTLYDGSRDLDFRVNALGEILYGQDPTSPTFVCSTLYDILKDNNDPRLYRICRYYINTKRAMQSLGSEAGDGYAKAIVLTDDRFFFLGPPTKSILVVPYGGGAIGGAIGGTGISMSYVATPGWQFGSSLYAMLIDTATDKVLFYNRVGPDERNPMKEEALASQLEKLFKKFPR